MSDIFNAGGMVFPRAPLYLEFKDGADYWSVRMPRPYSRYAVRVGARIGESLETVAMQGVEYFRPYADVAIQDKL